MKSITNSEQEIKPTVDEMAKGFAEFIEQTVEESEATAGKKWGGGTEKKSKKKTSSYLEKSRYFVFLIYHDSFPRDGLQQLEALGQPIAISPAHNKDIDTKQGNNGYDENGNPIYKKAHRHCIYVANNNVTAGSVRKKIVRALGAGAVNMVKICDSVENYFKYFTHESSDAIAKGKHVYDAKDIILLNNFDISRYTDLSKEAKEDWRDSLCELIMVEKLANVIQLSRFITEHPECGFSVRKMHEVIASYGGLIRMYMDGVYQERTAGRD